MSGEPSGPATTEMTPEPAPAADHHGEFARRVAGVLTTKVSLFVIAFATSILMSRLLGRDGKGIYYAVATLPTMLSTFGVIGLPSAVNYFAGRGMSVSSLIRAAYILTAAISVVLVGLVWFLLPALEGSILSAARDHDDLLRLIVLVIPLGILTSFGGSILYGRQEVRAYNIIQISMAAVTFTWAVIVVGIMGQGVRGAVYGSVLVAVTMAVLVMAAVHRLGRRRTEGPQVSYRGLASYGARLYPGSLFGYFSYRADTYILQAVTANSSGPLGLYSLAVTMDELVFYVPDSVSTLFLPRVAGATVEDSSRMVGRVGRLTMLLTVAVAICLIPAAIVGVHLVLPAFVDCLPAFLVLLPGVVSLSVAKVMTSYVGGRGRPGLVAIGTMISVLLNVALNLVLIPMYGIVGAALASVISYSIQAAFALFFASRLAGQSPLSMVVPGRAEVALVIATLPRLMARVPGLRRLVRRNGGAA
jgi:O-antigen/teichoic acid export membrane protein